MVGEGGKACLELVIEVPISIYSVAFRGWGAAYWDVLETESLYRPMVKTKRTKRCKGAEMLEFTFAFIPLMMMVFLLLDACWGMFVKSTLAFAVHEGVRYGITVTKTDLTAVGAPGADLAAAVKATVQRNALGLLASDDNFKKIKIRFFQPPASDDVSGVPVDVTSNAVGNAPFNIMQVTVEGYALGALTPRLYGLGKPVDKSATMISAIAADMIEPSRDLPSKGTVP